MNSKSLFILPFMLAFLTISCICQIDQNTSDSDGKVNMTSNQIENYVNEIRDMYGIPGLSLAVIKDGEVIFKNDYGYASIEHEVRISDKSIYRIYSLTKPFIAVGVFHLIEKGKLRLEDSVAQYVMNLPESWGEIRIKHLLSHSSGLPDMVGDHPYDTRELTEEEAKSRVFEMPNHFFPGERFEYNQTNFWLLKEIIEKVSEMNLAEFIAQHQFPNSPDFEVFFSADSRDIIKHRVTPYFPFAKGYLIADLPYTTGDYLFATNSLNITMDEFIKWDLKFNRNQFISRATIEKMWDQFPYSMSSDIFGFSWGISNLNQKPSYGFSGSMSTIYRIYPEDKLSIIFLTNGFTTMYDMGNAVNNIANLVLK